MNKISKRDKVLLYIMIVALILYVGGFLYLRPLYNEIKQKRENVTAVQDEQLFLQASVEGLESLRAITEENRLLLEDNKSKLKPYVNDEEAEQEISDLLEKHSLYNWELNIGIDDAHDVYTTKEIEFFVVGAKEKLADLVLELDKKDYIMVNSIEANFDVNVMGFYNALYNEPIEGEYKISVTYFMAPEE